ncbi:hypothetical protein TNCV_3363961 [Trichonephila clavipes]|nr:hypothetical protein TNCV_3363961 [Trichonephila clavipes]
MAPKVVPRLWNQFQTSGTVTKKLEKVDLAFIPPMLQKLTDLVWDLVCSREWLVSLAKSIYMVGFLLSVITFGQISDLSFPNNHRMLLYHVHQHVFGTSV